MTGISLPPLGDQILRSGCCADRRKPCPYHEGYIDGYEAHWDEAALKFLLENHVHVMFLRSHSSITTQPNDNGVNQLWKDCYSRAYIKWSREYPGSAFTGGSSDYVLQ